MEVSVWFSVCRLFPEISLVSEGHCQALCCRLSWRIPCDHVWGSGDDHSVDGVCDQVREIVHDLRYIVYFCTSS